MTSIWVDYLDREFLDTTFKDWVNSRLVNGLTSNPAIFSNALKKDVYKGEIEKLKKEGKNSKEIYEELAVRDIQKACDILEPLYDEGDDGFASIEVDPRLINDAKGTIDEALRLYDKIERDNVMIKIPANEAGYKAMEELAKRGININATLVFSPNQAMKSLEAISKGGRRIEGVISVFVSRFDRKLNNQLDMQNLAKDRVGFFNAIKIYNQIEEAGYSNIRTLFASTGVKQDYLNKDYYVENLYLPHSVLTLPLDVIEEIKNKELNESFHFQTKHIDAFFSFLTPAGINMQKVYQELFDEGVEAFEKAFEDMLNSIK
ncbi:transaldolase [Caminibacter mediatlanticus]|uniref:Transaldolase n=1 Tax=Caminibacter mediatlanticus TB-2 TaxID=391592 RepID=A0AAI9AI67_9BACT|nr:transaldolase [Caminibacter mediatlanticus]EDM24103.1 transaldolase [Caminibacter mediatlanticus TB-2]